MSLFLFVLLVSLVRANVDDVVGYIFNSQGGYLELYIAEFLPTIGFNAPSSFSYVTTSDVQDLENEIVKLVRDNKRVIFGYLPQFELNMISEIASKYSVIFATPALSTEDSCFNNTVQGYSACRSISRVLELVKHDYKSFTIMYDSQSNIEKCTNLIYDYLKYNLFSNPLIKKIVSSSDIDVSALESDDVILNFLSTSLSNDLYSATPRSFNIIGFQNIDIQQQDLTKMSDTYIASESNDDCGSLSFATTSYPNPNIEQFAIGQMLFLFLSNSQNVGANGQVDLHKLLTSTRFSFKESTIHLLPNLRLSSQISLSKIDSTDNNKLKPIYVIEGMNSLYYSDILDNQYEMLCDMANYNEEVKSTDYYMILITYLTGTLAEYDSSVKIGFKIAFEILNEERLILNRKTHPIYIDANNSNLNDDIIHYLDRFNVIAIFTTMEYSDFELFTEYANETIFNTPFIYLNLVPNEIVSNKYFFSGMNIGNLWRETKTSFNPKNIFFIGNKGIVSTNAITYISYDSSLNGINIRGKYILDSNIYEHAVNACNEIEAECNLYSDCYIISFLERNFTLKFFEEYKKSGLRYPIISYNLDELMINSVNKSYYDNHYAIGYYFNEMELDDNADNRLNDYLDSHSFYKDVIVTSNTAIIYSEVMLFASVIDITREISNEKIKNSMKYGYVIGPGGVIKGNNEGYNDFNVNTGIIHDGKIEEIHQSFFVEESTVFSDSTKYFDRESNQIKSREVKTIIFLYVRNQHNEDKINHFILYDSFVIEYLNNQYDGVAGYRIRSTSPELYSNEDLVNYVRSKCYDDDLLLFAGTLTSSERESIQQLLIDCNKLLLSIHPSVGNECYRNIIQFGVLPQHYIFTVIAYWYKHSKNCVMIYGSNEVNKHTANFAIKYTEKIKNYQCDDVFVSDDSNLTEIIENQIVRKYTDGCVVITALDERTEELLIEMSNYSSSLYPIVITDYIEYKYFESNNKEYYENAYFTSSYNYHINNEETRTMSETITNYYGKSKELMTTTSLTLYSALRLFSSCYNSNNSDEIRYNMYDEIITSPMGRISVDTNNLMRMFAMMIHIKNNISTIVLSSDYSYYESQFSDILNNGEYLTCHFEEGSKVDVVKEDAQEIGIWIEDDESVRFTVQEYLYYNKYTFGSTYVEKVLYCSDEESIFKMVNDSSISYILSACNKTVNSNIAEVADEKKVNVFILEDQFEPICEKRFFIFGSSSSQRLIPLIQYLFTVVDANVFVILPLSFNNSIEIEMIQSTVDISGGKIIDILFIDEDDGNENINSNVNEMKISTLISSVFKDSITGGVILNYLKKYNEFVYRYLDNMIKYHDIDPRNSKSKFVVISMDIDSLLHIENQQLLDNHLALGISYISKETSKLLYDISTNTYGEGNILKKIESRGLIAIEFILAINIFLENDESHDFLDYVHNNEIATSLGNVKIDSDNYYPSIVSVYCANNINILNIRYVLSNKWPGETYRVTYQNTTLFPICNVSNPNKIQTRLSINIIMFVALSGNYKLDGYRLLLSYLSIIDYMNYNSKLNGLYINPIVIDTKGGYTVVREVLLKMSVEYNTKITMGLDNSVNRKEIANELEGYDVLLAYPYDFEGYECKENIVYIGVPFASKVTYLSWILGHLNKKIYIVYTDSYDSEVISKMIRHELKLRGYSIVGISKLPQINYNLKEVTHLVHMKLPFEGVILSFLKGNAGKELYKVCYEEGIKYPNHYIVSDNLDISNLNDEDGNYMMNHYIWNTYPEELYEVKDYVDIYDNKYTFITNTVNSFIPAFLSVEVLALAFQNIPFSDNYSTAFTVDLIINKIHNVSTPEIKIYNNNYASFSLSMKQIRYNETSKQYFGEIIYKYQSSSEPNPWGSTFDLDRKYICDWNISNPNRNETIEVEAVSVALVFPITDVELGNYATEILESAISTLSEINDKNHGVNGLYIDYIVYDYKVESEEVLSKIAYDILENQDIVSVFGCLSDGCKKIISNILQEKEIALWYPGLAYGETCDKYIYYTNAVTNQIIDPLVNYLTTYKNNRPIVIISDTRPESESITAVLNYQLGSVMKIDYILRLEPIDGSSQAKVIKIIESLPNGAIFLCNTLRSNFKSIINGMNNAIFSSGLFSIISIGIDRDILSTISLSYLYDFYLISPYFQEHNTSNIYYLSYSEYTGLNNTYMVGNALYIAIHLWKEGVEKANSFDNDLIRLKLYDHTLRIECGYGSVTMESNNYVTNPFFLAHVNPMTKELIIEYEQLIVIDPMAFNWNINGSYGRVCDFSNELTNPETVIIPFVIVVAIAVTGHKQLMESGIYNVIDMCITDINTQYNGLLNHRLYMQKIDIGSDDSDCYETLPNYIRNNNINVIFTTASELCINILLSQESIKNIPIFHVGYTAGESCHKQVVYGGKDPSVIDRIVDVIFNVYDESTYHYSIIGTIDQASQNCIDYSTKYLEDKGATIHFTTTVDMNSITDVVVDHITSNIHDQAPDGCYILFFGTAQLHKMIDDSFKRIGMSTEVYKILSFTTADIMFSYDNISSFYSAQSYFPSSETDESDIQLLNHIKEYTDVPITEYMINAYNVFQIWSKTVMKLNTVDWNEILPNMYNQEFELPEGIIKVHTNNYLDHFLGITKYNTTTKKFDSIYNTVKPINPEPWKKFINDGRFLCDFSIDSVGAKKKQSTISIGLLVSYSGANSIAERSAADGITFAVNEINEGGGLLGKIIVIEKRDPQSQTEYYISYAIELAQLDTIKAVFGGGRYSTQKLLLQIFDPFKMIYFYPGITGGNICSKYCFSTQTTVNQYTTVLLKYVFPYYTNIIFISQGTDFANSLILSLKAVTSINKNNFYGPIIYPTLNELYEDFSLEIIKNSAILIVANAESYSDVVNDLCDHNIYAYENGIYAVTADSNRLINVKPECIKGLKIISTFIKELGLKSSDTNTYVQSSELFVQSIIDSNGYNQIFTPTLEAGYTSLKLYAHAVKSSYSVDIDKVNQQLWGYRMNTPTGTMDIGYNGYANRVMFLCEAVSIDEFKVVDFSSNPEYADTYDQYLSENYGYVCDWTDKGEKYQLKLLKIAFFHEYNVSTYVIETQIMVEEYNIIRDFNENKINGYSFLPYMYFCSTEEEYNSIFDKLKNDTDLVLIVGCRSATCRNYIIPKAEEMNKLFLYTGITVGLSCSGNLVTFGTSARQKIDSVKKYLLDNHFESFMFLSTEEELFTSYYTLLSQSLKESFEITQVVKIIINTKSNNEEIKDGVNTMISRIGNVRTAVFFYLSGSLASLVLQEIANRETSLTKVNLILMRFSRGDYSDELLMKLSGTLIPATYASDLSNPLSQSFQSDMKAGLGNTINISEEMEYVYSALHLWKISFENSIVDSGGIDNPPIEYVRLNMINKQFSSPSGPMVLDKTLYVKRSMYIFRINDNGKFIQIYPKSGSTVLYDPIPYPDGTPKECNFGKQLVYFEYNTTMKAVAYVLMSIAIVLSIWSLLFTFASKNKIIIKSFGRSYSFIFAMQLFILSLSVIPMTIPPTQSNHVCTVRVVMLGLCVKGVLGLMIAKCVKIYKRYLRLKKNIKKSRITMTRLVVTWLLFELLETLILVLWFILDPNEYIERYSQSNSGYFYDEYVRECTTSTPFLYDIYIFVLFFSIIRIVEFITDGIPLVILLYITNVVKNRINEYHEGTALFISSCVINIFF